MDALLIFLLLILFGFALAFVYHVGKESGREEAYMEKSIEVIPYNGKDIVLISEDYFSQEQAQQIKDVIEKDRPIIYKPSKRK